MSETRRMKRSKNTQKKFTEKYDPNGDQELFYAMHITIDSDKFYAAREVNESKGRQVDFLFDIDGVKTEITFEEMVEFINSRKASDD